MRNLALPLVLASLAFGGISPVVGPVRVAPLAPEWVEAAGPNGPMRTAIFRPPGRGPFPVLVVLHGAYGIDRTFLDWASRFAADGYGVVVGCYTRHTDLPPEPGWAGAAVRCPQLPPPYAEEFRGIDAVLALMDAARRIPGARSNSLGLVGWSLGAGLATDVASTGAEVRAVVAISGGAYGAYATALRAPVLLLHGKRDDVVSAAYAVEYAGGLRAAGRKVQLVLYDDGDHFLPFGSPAISEDVRARVVAFLRRYLPP